MSLIGHYIISFFYHHEIFNTNLNTLHPLQGLTIQFSTMLMSTFSGGHGSANPLTANILHFIFNIFVSGLAVPLTWKIVSGVISFH